jgi:hypothetical protein
MTFLNSFPFGNPANSVPNGRSTLAESTPGSCVTAFSVWTQCTVQTGKRSELPRGMPLVTRGFASSEHAWDPMASSSVNFCRKTRTVPQRTLRTVLSPRVGSALDLPFSGVTAYKGGMIREGTSSLQTALFGLPFSV